MSYLFSGIIDITKSCDTVGSFSFSGFSRAHLLQLAIDSRGVDRIFLSISCRAFRVASPLPCSVFCLKLFRGDIPLLWVPEARRIVLGSCRVALGVLFEYVGFPV